MRAWVASLRAWVASKVLTPRLQVYFRNNYIFNSRTSVVSGNVRYSMVSNGVGGGLTSVKCTSKAGGRASPRKLENMKLGNQIPSVYFTKVKTSVQWQKFLKTSCFVLSYGNFMGGFIEIYMLIPYFPWSICRWHDLYKKYLCTVVHHVHLRRPVLLCKVL